MSTADRLLEQISSWIEQREICSDQLRNLARELESLRENCNVGECVGSSMAATYTGINIMIYVAAQITRSFLSSNTMKKAKKAEERSNKIADEIQQLFQELKDEAKAANPDELDRHITAEILTAMARRSGVRGGVSIHCFNDEPKLSLDLGSMVLRFNKVMGSLAILGVAGVLAFFTFQPSEKEFQPLFDEGVKQRFKTAFKTVLKGGAKVVGGAVGMAFALPEAIDNWTEMIKKNHVTEASQSLRDTANAIRQVTQMLREQLDSTRRTLDEMAKRQREREEKKKEEEKAVHLKHSAVDSQRNKNDCDEYQCNQRYRYGQEGGGYEWSSEKKRESGRSIKTGGQAPGGDDPLGKKSDRQKITIDLSKKVSMALLNVNSIKNKLSPVSGLINEYQLQVLSLTETKLRPDTGDYVLTEGLPEGFRFFHQPREGRGGGVAIVFSEKLEAEPISLGSYTFEYLAVVMNHQCWRQPMLTITLYRPPKGNMNKFLEEGQSLLDEVSHWFESILVTGDFNIWVDVENRRPTRRFRKFLKDNGFRQHVEEPTYPSGHTLDLIISRNVDVSNLSIQDNEISDHKTVLFSARPRQRT